MCPCGIKQPEGLHAACTWPLVHTRLEILKKLCATLATCVRLQDKLPRCSIIYMDSALNLNPAHLSNLLLCDAYNLVQCNVPQKRVSSLDMLNIYIWGYTGSCPSYVVWPLKEVTLCAARRHQQQHKGGSYLSKHTHVSRSFLNKALCLRVAAGQQCTRACWSPSGLSYPARLLH